jgi:hypothetical protein
MERLDRYQKALLILLALMALVFLVIYGQVSRREGYRYNDRIFVPEIQNGATVYTGKLDGQEAVFTVSGNTVTFRWGEIEYGPYTCTEDPTAIPQDNEFKDSLTGIEVLEKEEVIFRGGVLVLGENKRLLFSQDGNTVLNITVSAGTGTVIDVNGNVVDPMEPQVHTILDLLEGPQLEKKGQWGIWLLCLLLSGITAISILFADELFHLRLSFRVADSYGLEPSDWEIFGRYTSWTLITGMILVCYILGMQ